MAGGEELLVLIDSEIPEGRRSLQENYVNLENVARYCEENYQRASPAEKAHALQETKNFTTHSLASVAYQINTLATNFLKLLDLQQGQLTDMESSVNHLNQIVMIHKEKVARREIGVLTAGRSVPRPLGMKNGIIYPEQTERPIRYTRKPIDFNMLDDIGHGVKPQGSTPRAVRSPSVSSNHSSNSAIHNSSSNNSAAAHQGQTTPVYQPGSVGSGSSQGGTMGRAAGSQYRATGPPVAPPMAPATASLPPQAPAGNFPQPHLPHSAVRPSVSGSYSPSSTVVAGSGGGAYSPSSSLVMGIVHSPGMGYPPAGTGSGYNNPPPSALGHNMMHPANPALAHPDPKVVYARNSVSRGQSWSDSSVLPPPPDEDFPEPYLGSPATSPLPPPPDAEQFEFGIRPPPQDFLDMGEGPPSTRDGRMMGSVPEDTYAATQGLMDQYAATGPQLLAQGSWIPPSYIEKVVAIYNYQANKSDELSFSENAIIYVIHKNDDGWWEGVMDGQTGLFPYNYVE